MKILTETALLAAVALILSWVESLIPMPVAVPGIKPGLANLAVLVALYRRGPGCGAAVNGVRILLAGFLFGSLFSLLYALCGAAVSYCVMLLLRRCRVFSVTGVSMMGGVFHNLAQLAVAALVTSTPGVFSYFPVLLIAGTVTGIVNGILAVSVLRRLPHIKG